MRGALGVLEALPRTSREHRESAQVGANVAPPLIPWELTRQRRTGVGPAVVVVKDGEAAVRRQREGALKLPGVSLDSHQVLLCPFNSLGHRAGTGKGKEIVASHPHRKVRLLKVTGGYLDTPSAQGLLQC